MKSSSTRLWSHSEIKPKKKPYIIDKVLLYIYSDKAFEVILLRKQTYWTHCVSFLDDENNNRPKVEENSCAMVERIGRNYTNEIFLTFDEW